MTNEFLSATQNMNFGTRLRQINSPEDVPEHWRNTPIADLIGAHNFDKPIEASGEPKLLLVTCIEYRFQPEIPAMWAT
jgi:hypothetical protein